MKNPTLASPFVGASREATPTAVNIRNPLLQSSDAHSMRATCNVIAHKQETGDPIRSRKLLAQSAALLAAAAATFALFSAVAGLADEDRALLLAAKHPPALIAGHGSPATR